MTASVSSEKTSLIIHDIRNGPVASMEGRQAILDDLLATPSRLPEFVLWDDKGLELFDRFSQTPSYYPFHSEMEILSQSSAEIVESILDKSAVIELGCGYDLFKNVFTYTKFDEYDRTVRKTHSILSALLSQDKTVDYYALDLSHQSIEQNIAVLRQSLEDAVSQAQLNITGLHGSYEDSLLYLSDLPEATTSITFLWLGNSIANFSNPRLASYFLKRLKEKCLERNLQPSFIISNDICEDISRMNECYDLDKPELIAWLRNGLDAANQVLAHDVFPGLGEHWKVTTEFEEANRNLETYYVALRDVELDLGDGSRVNFEEGARIGIITSGKWTGKMMEDICLWAGLGIKRRWKDGGDTYCVYLLQSTP